MKRHLVIAGIIFAAALFASCSSLDAGIYRLVIDHRSGGEFLACEQNSRVFLERVLDKPHEYVIGVYERCVLNHQIKREKLLRHNYYVITHLPSGEYHTLSFYGTKIAFYSDGAWSLDTDYDLLSYMGWLEGKKQWDVYEVDPGNDTNVKETVKNIIKKMDSDVTYYYQDHIKDKQGVDNCNTALWETLERK